MVEESAYTPKRKQITKPPKRSEIIETKTDKYDLRTIQNERKHAHRQTPFKCRAGSPRRWAFGTGSVGVVTIDKTFNKPVAQIYVSRKEKTLP